MRQLRVDESGDGELVYLLLFVLWGGTLWLGVLLWLSPSEAELEAAAAVALVEARDILTAAADGSEGRASRRAALAPAADALPAVDEEGHRVFAVCGTSGDRVLVYVYGLGERYLEFSEVSPDGFEGAGGGCTRAAAERQPD